MTACATGHRAFGGAHCCPVPEHAGLRIALVLGSGWHGVADRVRDGVDIAYRDLPAFPTVGVAGHAGTLRVGRLGGVDVAVLSGRQHTYETGQADAMKGAIRTLARLGVRLLLPTNAAGSLDPAMRPGSLMMLSGPPQHRAAHAAAAVRAVPSASSTCAMPTTRRCGPLARRVAGERGVTLHEGVYAWVIGPQFETPAEIRMLRVLGAQAVGMSTVPETILARHAGLRVLALSMLTNMAAGMEDESLSPRPHAGGGAGRRRRAVDLLQAVLPAWRGSSEAWTRPCSSTARPALACLDLTSLNDHDDAAGRHRCAVRARRDAAWRASRRCASGHASWRGARCRCRRPCAWPRWPIFPHGGSDVDARAGATRGDDRRRRRRGGRRGAALAGVGER